MDLMTGMDVLYRPTEDDPGPALAAGMLSARVAHMNDDGTANLTVFDANGGTFSKRGVHQWAETDKTIERGFMMLVPQMNDPVPYSQAHKLHAASKPKSHK